MYIPENPAPTMTASNSVVEPARATRDSVVELAMALPPSDCVSGEYRERFEAAAQQVRGAAVSEPTLDDARIHAAAIRRVDEVVSRVELREARQPAVVSALHAFADHEHEIGRAVVGPEARVLGDAPAEFGKDHQHHLIASAEALDVTHEASHRVRHIRE